MSRIDDIMKRIDAAHSPRPFERASTRENLLRDIGTDAAWLIERLELFDEYVFVRGDACDDYGRKQLKARLDEMEIMA